MKKCLTLVLASLALALPLCAQTASPTLIPFQGQLTSQAGVAYTAGQYTIVFNLYNQAVGGTSIWTERHQKVGVINGMVNVFLGSIITISTVDFSQVKYLGITIDADDNANTADPEMVPRQMIIPAFYAKNADRLQGLSEAALLPPGTVLPFAGTTPPSGFLLCNGSAVSRTTYLRLFAAISNNHGAPDVATFNLPDYRGRFLRGVDGGAGNDPDANSRTAMKPGGQPGNVVGSVQSQATRKNGLSIIDPGHSHTLNGLGPNGTQNVAVGTPHDIHYTTVTTTTNTTGTFLSNGDNETRPANAYVNYIIKY